jgi:trans-aconitate methyltransferase
MVNPSHSSYPLSRNFRSTARLNYQHFLWQETLGYLVHPDITLPSDSPSRIVEVACGSAIWSIRVAKAYPRAQVDSSDLSLEQTPPTAWLPSNVSLREWDMFTPPPSDLIGQCDLVHVRLVVLVVNEDNIGTFLHHLTSLLKPGGWLQWEDLDMPKTYVEKISDSLATPTLDQYTDILRTRFTWVNKVPEIIQERNFAASKILRYQDSLDMAKAFFEAQLGRQEDEAEVKDEAERNIERDQIGRAIGESAAGAVICTPKFVCLARTAL